MVRPQSRKKKIVEALEANALAQRAGEQAEEALTAWWESQEPDSTAEEWLAFAWGADSDTDNHKFVKQAQERATISRGNAATARANAERAWKDAQSIWLSEGWVRETAEVQDRTSDIMRKLGDSQWAEKYGESLQTAQQANELEANAEALELVGIVYTLASQAFDAEANAWTALVVWTE